MIAETEAQSTRRKLLMGAAGALAAGALGGLGAFRTAAQANGMATLTRAGIAFQTPVAFTIAGRDAARLEIAMTAAFTALRDVENATSVYRPESDLSRLNRDGLIRAPSRHLVALVDFALNLARRTDGVFDPTVQPLWDVWSTHAARGERPSDASLQAAVERIDYRLVALDTHSIRYTRPSTAMTLNSINQGYASDVIMDVLRAHGIEHAFVDSGEFAASGHHPTGRDWRLGVVAPRDTDRLAFTLDPFRRFAATSGDYKTFFSPDFKDHHIFDPRTGRSPPGWSSITVEAPRGLLADGLSTALFVQGLETGQRLLASYPGCQARWFDKTGAEATPSS